MKKFSLLLCCFVALLVSQKVWADVTYPYVKGNLSITITYGTNGTNGSLTIKSATAGDLATFMASTDTDDGTVITAMKGCKSLILIGKFSSGDLETIKLSGSDFNFTVVNMSQATFPSSGTPSFFMFNTTANNSTGNNNDRGIVGGTLYKSSHTTTNSIDPITASVYSESVENREDKSSSGWSEREMSSHSSDFQAGKYYKVLVAAYYQKQPDWVGISEVGGEITIVETLPQSNNNLGDKVKVPSGYGYYKLSVTTDGDVTTRSWVTATQEEIENQNFIFDSEAIDSNKDSRRENYNDGDYVKFATGYNYYEWQTDKKWASISESEIPADANISYYTTAFNSTDHLGDGNSIAGFYDHYNYYYVSSTTTYYWRTPAETYNDGEQKSISYQSSTYAKLPVPTTDDQLAVVGGTEYIKKDGNWDVASAYDNSDWTVIKFGKWAGSIKTAILPAAVTENELNMNDLWKNDECSLLEFVQSGSTIATIYYDNSDRKALLNVADGSDEFTRMRAILKKNSFIGQDEYITSETGYNNSTGKYTVQGNFDPQTINGSDNNIRVLDLRNATPETITKANLEALTKSTIEYIILPGGKDKDFVYKTNYSSSLSNLHAVISAQSYDADDCPNPNLVAYVKVAGSLAEARCLATGNSASTSGDIQPTPQHLTTVTLAGNLNANDITANQNTGGLNGERSTISSIDLTDAYFADVNDMKLGPVGFSGTKYEVSLTEVKLPTDSRITEIPASCLYGIQSLTSLHIPYNYTKIGWLAFWETGIDHITTEDANHKLIDNGPKTYTLSAAITELGKADEGEGQAVFPQTKAVTDVYCLATTVPTCYAHTFHADMVYGQGGGDDSKIYCRERYTEKSANEAIAVLHFPSLESWTDAGDNKEGSYDDLLNKYTDPTRVYTKKDQTGAVDANGNPILWPSQTEMNFVRQMALSGNIWDDYSMVYTNDGRLVSLPDATGGPHDFNPNYSGWHEFILTQAAYVEQPQKEVVQEDKVIHNYVDAGWYTFCIPYDLTYKQVIEMMGIPASDDKVVNYLGATKSTSGDVVSYTGGTKVEDLLTFGVSDLMPEIRQLKEVIRTPKGAANNSSNIINIRLTTDLADPTNKTAKYLDFGDVDKGNGTEWNSTAKYANSKTTSPATANENAVCLIGGRPYFVHAYIRDTEIDALQGSRDHQYNYNLGKFIMMRYADEFTESASCVNNADGGYEQMETFQGTDVVTVASSNLNTMRFAKPYENHKVQAFLNSEDGGQLMYTETVDGEVVTYKYYYTFVGQFWQQDMPQYCVYWAPRAPRSGGGTGVWYRYTDSSYGFQWDPYKCVIMATPEIVSTEDLERDIKEKDLTTTTDDVIKTSMAIVEKVDDEAGVLTHDEITAGVHLFKQLPSKETVIENDQQKEVDWTFKHFGGGFRNISMCYFPMNFVGTTDWIHGPLKLTFFGRDDQNFDKQTPSRARYIVSMGDDDVIMDYGEDVTEVKAIETLNGVPQLGDNSKVYNMSGQYLGNSTDGLSKGVYIVGGRKVVVK